MKLITSWDDGDRLDLKVAELLEKHSIAGTFFIPLETENPDHHLSERELYELGRRFPVGGHTFHHVKLAQCSPEKAKEEIETGKKALQEIVQKEISAFGFPFGSYNRNCIELVRAAGFTSARNVRLINFHARREGEFVYSPNFHLFPHRLAIDLGHCVKAGDGCSLMKRLCSVNLAHLDLCEKATALFEGDVLHLWGHSWEVEKYGLWEKLEEILRFFSPR